MNYLKKKEALLIVDVQKAMFCYGEIELYKGNEVLENIKKVLKQAREKNITVIFIQHTDSDLDSEFCEGKLTWEIHDDIKPRNNEFIVQKSKWDSFYKTKLLETLKAEKITDLIIMGMQTEFCIDTTTRSAYSHGFNNTLIKDAHSTFDSSILRADDIVNHHNNIIGNRFAKLKNAYEIVF